VHFATAGGSATEGVDYTAASGTLSWASGDMADKVVAIPVADDASVEGSETLTLTLSAWAGAELDGSSTLTLTISDNDANAPSASGGGGGSPDLALIALLTGVLLSCHAARRRSPSYQASVGAVGHVRVRRGLALEKKGRGLTCPRPARQLRPGVGLVIGNYVRPNLTSWVANIRLGKVEISPVGFDHNYPHFESPQLRHVMQPSIITTAAVLHLLQSCAPCG
jgi:hypothetical protein